MALNHDVMSMVVSQIEKSDERYGEFASTHEGLGVLTEEVDELETAIHENNLHQTGIEATQIAAVAMRLATACLAGSVKFSNRSTK